MNPSGVPDYLCYDHLGDTKTGSYSSSKRRKTGRRLLSEIGDDLKKVRVENNGFRTIGFQERLDELEEKKVKYHLLKTNCEHIANYLRSGVLFSRQIVAKDNNRGDMTIWERLSPRRILLKIGGYNFNLRNWEKIFRQEI